MVLDDRFPILFSYPTFPGLIESIADHMIFLYVANRLYPLTKPCCPLRAIRALPVFQHSIRLCYNGFCHLTIINNISGLGQGNQEIRKEALSFFLMRFLCNYGRKPGDHSRMVNTLLNHIQDLYNHTFIAIVFT